MLSPSSISSLILIISNIALAAPGENLKRQEVADPGRTAGSTTHVLCDTKIPYNNVNCTAGYTCLQDPEVVCTLEFPSTCLNGFCARAQQPENDEGNGASDTIPCNPAPADDKPDSRCTDDSICVIKDAKVGCVDASSQDCGICVLAQIKKTRNPCHGPIPANVKRQAGSRLMCPLAE